MKTGKRFAIDSEDIVLAPYVWRPTGRAATARIEANMPGAYVRATFTDATEISLLIDGSGNAGCPAEAMPMIDWSIDEGPFVAVQLVKLDDEYALPLLIGTGSPAEHRIEVFFRSARLEKERWTASTYNLRIAGFAANEGARVIPSPKRSKFALGFGDSITEGVYSDVLHLDQDTGYYKRISENNARITWFPLACAALDCEYGQCGSGGQGMAISHLQMPPLADTWDNYCANHSRLVDGKLLPEPDYVFCAMGTNDSVVEKGGGSTSLDITEPYLLWLVSLRAACPNAHVFCMVPPLGWHSDEIERAILAFIERNDDKVSLMDTAPLRRLFKVGIPTQAACDGVHPHGHGNALLGALIAAEAQKAISLTDRHLRR